MNKQKKTKSHVTRIHDGQSFPADLMASTCSFIRCQDMGVPCGHAVATIHHRKARAPIDYIPKISRQWVEIYKHDMAPLDPEYPKRFTKLDSNSLHQWKIIVEKTNLVKIPRGSPAKKRV